MRVDGGVGLGEAVALEHVQQGSLSGIVETKEDNVSALLEEAKPLKSWFEKVYHEHIDLFFDFLT